MKHCENHGHHIMYIGIVFALSCCNFMDACPFQPDSTVRCEVVQYKTCRSLAGGINHNTTSFPNVYNHRSQAEVESFLQSSQLLQLVPLTCSPYIAHLICSAVYPLCYHMQFERVEPCREMCVEVRDSCSSAISPLEWPEALNCDKFQPFGTKLCIWRGNATCGPISLITSTTAKDSGRENVNPTPLSSELNCTGHLIPLGKNSKISFGGRDDCTESCHGIYFERHQGMLLTICITCLSMLSFVVSVFIVLTYILNFKSIDRLECPIYYIALCYTFLGLANITSMALRRESLICDHQLQNSFNQSAVITDGLTNPLCSTLFSIAYYFTLCSWTWWCALTLQWFLSNLGTKTFSFRLTLGFHVISWGTPLLFLLVVLGTGEFSGDPTTQTCWIHKDYKVPFIIFPLAASLLFCSFLVLIRFAIVLTPHYKRLQDLDDGDSKSLPSLTSNPLSLFKLCIYIVLSLTILGVLFCCYFYDFWYREAWENFYLRCSSKPTLQTCDQLPKSSRPSLPVYLAQVCTSVCMGFLSVMWVLRKDLMKAWKKTCGVFCAWRKLYPTRFEVRTPETVPGDSPITLKDIEEHYEEKIEDSPIAQTATRYNIEHSDGTII